MKDQKGKVSVITVCYNASETIENTILSVLNQSYDNYEYIVIDGNSSDETLSIINKYSNKITKIVSESDKGIYDAMNKGIKLSTGEWLHFLNAGDRYADNDVLSNIFKSGIEDNVNVLFSDYYTKREDGAIVRFCVDIIHRPSFNHQSTIYRKKLHNEHGMYIVTPQIIISDILFFYSIPTQEMQKTDTVIAFFDNGGVSSIGNWSLQQWLCADVVFRRRSFGNMLVTYYYRRLRDGIPYKVRKLVNSTIIWKKKSIS